MWIAYCCSSWKVYLVYFLNSLKYSMTCRCHFQTPWFLHVSCNGGHRLSSRTWNPTTSPWMKQLTWLRIIHSGDWCIHLALRTPSGRNEWTMNVLVDNLLLTRPLSGQFFPWHHPHLPRCQQDICCDVGVQLSYMYWMTSILVSGTYQWTSIGEITRKVKVFITLLTAAHYT